MSEILRGLSFQQYVEIEALNWSKLKVMAKSPAHYQWQLTAESAPDTDSLQQGRAVHTALLEPGQYDGRYAVWRGGRRSGKEWDAFETEAHSKGLEVLTAKQDDVSKAIKFAARTNPEVSRLLSGGKAEVTVLSEVGCPSVGDLPGRTWRSKSRVDYLNDRAIVDLKSTKSANPGDFARDAWNLGYLGQAAFYSDAVKAATGVERAFYFLAVEKTAPYVVTPFVVTDELLEIGREFYMGLLARLALCERENRWPGYVDGVTALEVPRWVERANEEDVSGIGLTFNSEE